MKRLVVTPSRCIACDNCTLACPYAHYHELRPERARIKVVRTGPEERGVPVVCLQCADPACMAVCPTGALRRNEELGTIEYLPGRCIRCLACAAACPFGNIVPDPDTRAPIKCDLCGGSPLCAVFCPTDALEYR